MRTFRYTVSPHTASMILTEAEQRSRSLVRSAMEQIADAVRNYCDTLPIEDVKIDVDYSFDDTREPPDGPDLERLREDVMLFVGDLVTDAARVRALREETYTWADHDDVVGELVLASLSLNTNGVLRDLMRDAETETEKKIAARVKALVEACGARNWDDLDLQAATGRQQPDARHITKAIKDHPLWEIRAGQHDGTLDTLKLRTGYANHEAAADAFWRFLGRSRHPGVAIEAPDGLVYLYESHEAAAADDTGASAMATIRPMDPEDDEETE